ncbi:hypothetical protein ABBQ32_004610 [Trebouxia sp. C0010 RCD-2024]
MRSGKKHHIESASCLVPSSRVLCICFRFMASSTVSMYKNLHGSLLSNLRSSLTCLALELVSVLQILQLHTLAEMHHFNTMRVFPQWPLPLMPLHSSWSAALGCATTWARHENTCRCLLSIFDVSLAAQPINGIACDADMFDPVCPIPFQCNAASWH